MNISKGRVKKPLKVVLYGPEGVGKSTLASRFPNPVFIDTEESTAHMDVYRFDKASSWQALKDQAEYIRTHPNEYQTLVIDTADWAEQMEIADLCKKNGWDSIETPGFGKGYTYSAEEFGKLLNILQGCVNAGVNVVITAHAQLRKVERPEEMGAYDHWEMKTSKKVAPMIREWADVVLFLNYKTVIVNVDGKGQTKGKNKATGGRRVMYTTHTPFWDAKNRFGLPDEIPLDFNEIAHILPTAAAMPEPTPAPAPAPKAAPKSAPKPAQKPAEPKPAEPGPKLEDAEPVGVDDFTGWTAHEKSWYRVGGQVFEFLKGEKIPPEVVRDGKPISEDVYLGMIRNIAQKDVKTTDTGGYQEPDMRIPKKLRDLMINSKISEDEIKTLVGAKGYFPADMAVADYPMDFVEGWCIGYWDQVKSSIMDMRSRGEIEYK